MITPLRWTARIAGLLAFVIGMMLGRLPMPALIRAHMTLGGLVVISLLIVALLSAGKVPAAKVGAGILWAVVTLLVALRQTTMLPGASHWIIEAVHGLLGIGAIGLTEMLAAARSRAGR
jgi:hypothetical protein